MHTQISRSTSLLPLSIYLISNFQWFTCSTWFYTFIHLIQPFSCLSFFCFVCTFYFVCFEFSFFYFAFPFSPLASSFSVHLGSFPFTLNASCPCWFCLYYLNLSARIYQTYESKCSRDKRQKFWICLLKNRFLFASDV